MTMHPGAAHRLLFALAAALTMILAILPGELRAQSYSFSAIEVVGNQRIEAATIVTYAGIGTGETVSAGELNDAYQRILGSGLFETVDLTPQGGRLVISVREYPTISRINIEGNRRLKDEDLLPLLQSRPRRVYSPSVAEADAQTLAGAYEQAGRFAASVSPRIIRRSDNRVDLVFEVVEGRVSEIDRISFVGNRNFSDRRLRRVLETKQAGLLRAIITRDTFIADRIEFDKQVLTDFYHSRGYIDFQVLSVTSEFARGRDAFFVTFNVREGQSFDFGEITTTSDLEDVDVEEFQAAIRIRPGKTYTPTAVERTIARLERLAIRKNLDFVRVEPRITRNDRDLTLDVEFALVRGPRIFVERIDIEGNTTTLDRVVRRQFRVVEGDPFNPREIREAAERIRALGFFAETEVEAREGSSPQQVIVDVNVEEQPTGSLSFGASYSVNDGVGLTASFSERNFLGRGQQISFSINTTDDSQSGAFSFTEPALLGRDLSGTLRLAYTTTDSDADTAFYSTRAASISPSVGFPVSENGRLTLRYTLTDDKVFGVDPGSSTILQAEAAQGALLSSAIGYGYSFDTRRTGLNPDAGVVLRFGQDIAGLGGDSEYLRTTALVGAETKAFKDEVTLRAVLEGGALHMISGNSRIVDRFTLGPRLMRGFEPHGIGPRDLTAANQDALGGNLFAVARLEAEFPLGLPEEYGLTGGLFFDVGSVWSLDNVAGTAGTVDDGFHLRSVIGFSLFWETPLGPLRFNFSNALQKESYDREQTFDLTISTTF